MFIEFITLDRKLIPNANVGGQVTAWKARTVSQERLR